MSCREIRAEALTRAGFADFGDVIETHADSHVACNEARFDRYMNLANIDTRDAPYTNVSLMVCRVSSQLPMDVPLMERHAHGSQAFVPIDGFSFVCVVAPATPTPDVSKAVAFVSNGRQGINMKRGIWHMPMIGFTHGQTFFVVDCGHEDNCDEFPLDGQLRLASL